MLVGGHPRSSSKSTKKLRTSDGGSKVSSKDGSQKNSNADDSTVKNLISRIVNLPRPGNQGAVKDKETNKIYSSADKMLNANGYGIITDGKKYSNMSLSNVKAKKASNRKFR